MGAWSPGVGGKGGNRKMSGANWLAILAELMSSGFSDRPVSRGEGGEQVADWDSQYPPLHTRDPALV